MQASGSWPWESAAQQLCSAVQGAVSTLLCLQLLSSLRSHPRLAGSGPITVPHSVLSAVLLQVLDRLTALPDNHQPGVTPLPHTHWLYWARLQADDFPAAAFAPSNQQQHHQDVLPGACDVNSLVRSLAQQLSEAGSASQAGASAVLAAEPAAAADAAEAQANSTMEQKQQSEEQSPGLQETVTAIVRRVAAKHGSRHARFVQELLTSLTRPDWRQHQQTYLRLVSGPAQYLFAPISLAMTSVALPISFLKSAWQRKLQTSASPSSPSRACVL